MNIPTRRRRGRKSDWSRLSTTRSIVSKLYTIYSLYCVDCIQIVHNAKTMADCVNANTIVLKCGMAHGSHIKQASCWLYCCHGEYLAASHTSVPVTIECWSTWPYGTNTPLGQYKAHNYIHTLILITSCSFWMKIRSQLTKIASLQHTFQIKYIINGDASLQTENVSETNGTNVK